MEGTGIPSSRTPTQPTMVGLEPTNQNPTSAARILRMTRPARNDADDQESPADQKQGMTSKEQRTPPPLRMQLTILLIPPPAGWRDPLSGNSLPDWTGRFRVSWWPAAIGGGACRRLGAPPPREALLSSPVSTGATLFCDGAESELRGEGALPTFVVRNTCVMAPWCGMKVCRVKRLFARRVGGGVKRGFRCRW